MLRLALTLCCAVLMCLSQTDTATAKQAWTTLGTAKADARTVSSTTITVGEGKGGFRQLRIKADGALTASRITVQFANAKRSMLVVEGVALEVGKPAVLWTSAEPGVVAVVSVSWAAASGANAANSVSAVTLTLEGLQDEGDADLKVADEKLPTRRFASPGPARDVTSPAPATQGAIARPPPVASSPPQVIARPSPQVTAPQSSQEAARPTTRGIGAASPSPTAGTTRAAAEPDGVCLTDNVCTPIPVFFGSNRNQLAGRTHVTFGYERPNKLTLGRTIVTVPKARKQGEIPRPTTLDWVRGVPAAGSPDRHFTIPKDGVKIYDSEDAFIAEAKRYMSEAGDSRDHAFIYVHGFAVSFENAMYRAAQMTYDLGTNGKPFGTAFVYTWPSQGSIFPTAYNYDAESVDVSIVHFRKFVELVGQKTKVKYLHVIAHSMGNRIVMRALDEAVKTGSPTWVSQVILAAPDVDKQVFEQLAANVSSAARGLTLYASQQDNALKISRVFRGNSAPPRAGEVSPPAGPAIVKGIDTIDISSLSTSYFLPDVNSHDKYADSPELLQDMSAIFSKAKPPPETRSNKFKKATFQTLEYWRYAK